MRKAEIVILLLVLAAIWIFPVAAERNERARIVTQCSTVGGFEVDGRVYRCKEKVPKP